MNEAELRSLERLCSRDDLSDSNVTTLTILGLKTAQTLRRLRAAADQRRECIEAMAAAITRLRALATAACDGWAGYLERRRVELEHVMATAEDDAQLAAAERDVQALQRDVIEQLRIRAALGEGL